MRNTACTIATCLPDWGAIATFLTGLAAVTGAVVIGRRQVGISEKQTDLADRTLRHDTFDRRMAVYDAVMASVVAIVREADYPSGEIEVEFLQAQRKASFLFGQPVVDAIDEVWRNGADFQLVKRTMTHLFDTTGDYGSGNVQKEHDLMVWFGGRLTALPTIFRAEMSVS